MSFDDQPVGGGGGNNPFGGTKPRGWDRMPSDGSIADYPPPPNEPPPPMDEIEEGSTAPVKKSISKKALSLLGFGASDADALNMTVKDKVGQGGKKSKNKPVPRPDKKQSGPDMLLFDGTGGVQGVRRGNDEQAVSGGRRDSHVRQVSDIITGPHKSPAVPAAQKRQQGGGGGPPQGGPAFDASANPFGAPPPKPAAEVTGPLDKALVNKNWKTRNAAYEQLQQRFNTADDVTDAEFAPFTALFPKMVADTNAAAQTAALDAINTFLNRLEEKDAGKAYVEGLLPGIVKKCIGATRPRTGQLTSEILMQLIELGCCSEVLEALLPLATDRLYKKATAVGMVVAAALREFGPRVVPIDDVLKFLPKLYSHANGQVRESAKMVGVEVYRWLGDMFKEQVADDPKLTDPQKKELATHFEKVEPGDVKPSRHLRGVKPKGGAKRGGGGAGGGGGGADEKEEDFDPMDLVKPVDIMGELPNNWEQDVFAPKWKDKKVKLDELIDLAKKPKIAPSPRIHDVVKCLQKLLSDSNVVVVGLSVKALASLATGLRTDFSSEAKMLIRDILELLKERKMTVNQPANALLDAFAIHCVPLADILEKVEAALNNKVPKVRVETAAWLVRTFKNPKVDVKALRPIARPMSDMLYAAMSDKDKDVRAESTHALGLLIGLIGARSLHAVIAKVETDDKKKHKQLMEFASEVEGADDDGDDDDGGGGGDDEPPPPPKPKRRRKKKKKKTDDGEERKRPRARSEKKGGGPPARLAAKSGGARGGGGGGAAPSGPMPSAADFKPDSAMPFEAAHDKVAEGFPDHVSGLESKKWKEKLESLTAINDSVLEMGEAVAPYTSALVYCINKTPSFKDSNAMVCAMAYTVCGSLAAKSPDFTRTHAHLVIPFLANKMSDRKIQAAGAEALLAFCEACGPEFVLVQLVEALKTVRSPVAVTNCVEWTSRMVSEFGLGTVPPQFVIAISHDWLSNANKKVRDAATEVLVAVYKQTGDVLKDKMLDPLKPATAAEVQAAFDAVPADEVGKSSAVRAVKGEEPAAPVSLDELVPRMDISGRAGPIVKKLKDKVWKTRKEGLDDIDALLQEASNRIGPNDGHLMAGLKPMLHDSNKNLIRQALDVIAAIATAMGPPIGKHAKYVMESIMQCCGDSKKAIVASAQAALRAWVGEAGLSSVIKYVPDALDNKMARADVLEIVVGRLSDPEAKEESCDLSDMITPTLLCLQDRTAAVRNSAEKLLEHVVRSAGYRAVKVEVDTLKPATKLTVQPILAKARDAVAGGDGDDDDDDDQDEEPEEKKSRSKSRGKRRKSPAAARARSGSRRKKKSPAPSRSHSKGRKGGASALRKKIEDDPGDEKHLQLASSSQRDTRLKHLARRLQGAYRHWARNEIEDLEEDMRQAASAKLHKLMFAKNDFKLHVKAIEIFHSAIEQYPDELFSQLDHVLRWLSWRMCEANTTVLLKTFEFLSDLFAHMSDTGQQLEEGEALSIIPFLINESLGDSKPRFRDSTREVLLSVANIYPTSKIFVHLQHALKNKNKRVVAESLNEMGSMFERLGLGVCKPEKTLLQIGKCVGSSDNGIRTAALGCLQQAYMILGEDSWEHLGGKEGRPGKKGLAPKQRDMIKERFKRTKVKGPSDSAAAPASESKHATSRRGGRPATAAASSGAGGASSASGRSARPSTAAARRRSRAGEHKSASHRDDADGMATSGSGSLHTGSAGAGSGSLHHPKVDSSVFDLDFDSIGVPSALRSSAAGGSSGVGASSSASKFVSQFQQQRSPSASAAQLADNDDRFGATSPLSRSSSFSSSLLSRDDDASPAPDKPSKPPATRFSPIQPAAAPAKPKVVASPYADEVEQRIIQIEAMPEEAERIEAMRWIWQTIKRENAAVVQPHTDRLVQVLVTQIRAAFAPFKTGEDLRLRLCKYALNLLLEIFQEADVAGDMRLNTHEALSEELLGHLVNVQGLTQNENGKHVIKSLNILMLKVLENADRTASFVVLIRFLTRTDIQEFGKLVVKCLLKITKALAATVDSLNLPIVMKALHEFFVANPRGSTSRSDTVVRTVRATLNEIVKLKKQDVLNSLDYVHPKEGSDIMYYIETMLAHQRPVDGPSATGQSTEAPVASSSDAVVALRERMARLRVNQTLPAPPSSTRQRAQELQERKVGSDEIEEIFAMLHKKETTQQALKMLYRYQQDYPDVDLSPYMSKTSKAFQGYIERGLKRQAAAEQARRAEGGADDAPGGGGGGAASGGADSSSFDTQDWRSRLAQLTAQRASAAKAAPRRRSSAAADPSSPPSDASSPAPPPSAASSGGADGGGGLAALRNRMKNLTGASDKSSAADTDDALARIRARVATLSKK